MKSIIFNTEMVKAILDGRKAQFRKVVKIKNNLTRHWAESSGVTWIKEQSEEKYKYAIRERNGGWGEYDLQGFIKNYSKYKVGDILYVKETFLQEINTTLMHCGTHKEFWGSKIEFVADGAIGRFLYPNSYNSPYMVKRPSVHLKQKDARIFLKVTNVSVERLNEITTYDMKKEGMWFDMRKSEIEVFTELWNSTAKNGCKREDNPYVFVYEFEMIK